MMLNLSIAFNLFVLGVTTIFILSLAFKSLKELLIAMGWGELQKTAEATPCAT